MAPGRDMLDGFGTIIREAMSASLQDAADIGGEKVQVTVRGYSFDAEVTSEEVTTPEKVLGLGIPSDTLLKEM